MKNKIIILVAIIVVIIIAIAISVIVNKDDNDSSSNTNDIQNDNVINNDIEENTVTDDNNDNTNIQEGEELSMKILLNNKEYEVKLNDTETTRDIVENMPLNLNLVRYAGHEYYSELPFRPTKDKETTSHIEAGHVYYWDGWNAFVINYIDYDIEPYQVVHIGEITDTSIIDVLQNADENISIEVTK